MGHCLSYDVLKNEDCVIYLNDDGIEIDQEDFEEELKTGYRAGVLMLPISNAVVTTVATMTPFHKDYYDLDYQFVIDNYHKYINYDEDIRNEYFILKEIAA